MARDKRTPLYDEHVSLGARLVPFAGWEMPLQYSGIVAEHESVRRAAGLFDVSHMGQLQLSGPAAVDVLNGLVPSDVANLADGKALYTCFCNEEGGILDDVIVYRRSSDDLLVVCNAANHDKIAAHLARHTADSCGFADIGGERGLLALQGPAAMEILGRLGSSPSPGEGLARFQWRDVTIDGRPYSVARTGYTGEDGVELFSSAQDAVALWRALFQAGKPLGLVPVGLGARDSLRLEASLPLYGNELDETTNPFEAGLGWIVKLDGPTFVGKPALERAKASGGTRVLVGFEMVGRGVARHGYPILDASGERVGTCTSGGPSPTLGKPIGLAYVSPGASALGSRLLVDCRGKVIEARVVRPPFYKRVAQ